MFNDHLLCSGRGSKFGGRFQPLIDIKLFVLCYVWEYSVIVMPRMEEQSIVVEYFLFELTAIVERQVRIIAAIKVYIVFIINIVILTINTKT